LTIIGNQINRRLKANI